MGWKGKVEKFFRFQEKNQTLEPVESKLSGKYMAEQFIERLEEKGNLKDFLKYYYPNKWEKMTREDKIKLLQGVENVLAEIYGRVPFEVNWGYVPKNCNADCKCSFEKIVYGFNYLDESNFSSALCTGVHEGTHALLFAIIVGYVSCKTGKEKLVSELEAIWSKKISPSRIFSPEYEQAMEDLAEEISVTFIEELGEYVRDYFEKSLEEKTVAVQAPSAPVFERESRSEVREI